MTIWNGITEQGAVVPIQVDAQGRVVVSGGGGVPSEVMGTAKAAATTSPDGVILEGFNLSVAKAPSGYFIYTFTNPMPTTTYQVVALSRELRMMFLFAGEITQQGFKLGTRGQDTSDIYGAHSVVVFDSKPTDVTPLILPTSTVNEVKALRTELDKLKKDKNP